MTVTVALLRAFVGSFMIGLGVGMALGVIQHLIRSVLSVPD
jgi:hypothetical protein